MKDQTGQGDMTEKQAADVITKFKKKFPVSGVGKGRSALIAPDGHWVRIHSYEHHNTCSEFGESSRTFQQAGGLRVSTQGDEVCIEFTTHFTEAMYRSLCACMRGEDHAGREIGGWTVSSSQDYTYKRVICVKPHHIKTEILRQVAISDGKVTTDIKEHVGA